MEKSLIEKVKDLVFEAETPTPEVETVELMEVKTADGAILKAENMEVGTPITLVDAEGMETPAEGDYTLEDGTVVKVAEGLIAEVVVAEIEEEEEQEMEEVNPLEQKVADLTYKLDEVLSKFSSLNDAFEAFKSEPAKEEIKLSKKDVKLSSRESALDKLRKFK